MIQILNKNIQDLNQQLEVIYDFDKLEKKENKLDPETLINIKNLISNSSINDFFANLQDPLYFKNLDYTELSDMFDLFETLYSKTKKIKEAIDIDIFFKEGYNLDIDKLKDKFRKKHLQKELPNFKFKRLQELYKYPPKEISTYYDENKKILIDPFIYRKYLIGIIQMVFNHMDLLVCSVGPEGAGKSLKISQDMLMMHWTLTEIGIIDYPFYIKDICFNSLAKFREAEDKYFNIPFRIFDLDEGNELNRQDWKDDEVKTFFQRLRRERYNRRIKFISLPVLGELITNIVLSRMNFISNMLTKNELKTATLYKGEYEFYIIPRGDTIYSPAHKKELTRTEIKSKLFINLKDKEYLKGMPKDIMVKKCKCNDAWGFLEKEYEKELKESNKTFSVNKGVHFSITELFMFYKSHVTARKIGIKKDDPRYQSLSKMLGKINNFFYNDPDMMFKYEAILKKKIEDKIEANS